MVSAVFFDADDTLFSVTPGVAEVYSEVCLQHGIRVSAIQIRLVIHNKWKQHLPRYLNKAEGFQTDLEREREFWRSFFFDTLTECTGSRPSEDVFEKVYLEFSKPHTRKIDPRLIETLIALKGREITLGVLSNHDWRLEKVIEGLGLTRFFDYIFPATTVGYKKPAAECFRFVEQQTGLSPGEILYVGNDPELDYEAPLKAGWKALLLRPRSEKAGSDNSIFCLSELIEIVQQL